MTPREFNINYDIRYQTEHQVSADEDMLHNQRMLQFRQQNTQINNQHLFDDKKIFDVMFSISSLPNIVIKKLNKASTQNAIIQNRVKMVNRKEKLKRRLFDRKIRERRQQKFDNLRKKTTQQVTRQILFKQKKIKRSRQGIHRRYNSIPGVLISEIKKLYTKFHFEGDFSDMSGFLKKAACFNSLINVIRVFGSKDGLLRQLRMVFNLNDPGFNNSIRRIRIQKQSKSQKAFINFLNQYELQPEVIDSVKSEIKLQLRIMLKDTYMKKRAFKRKFNFGIRCAETTTKKQDCHQYFRNFKDNLASDFGILRSLDRKKISNRAN